MHEKLKTLCSIQLVQLASFPLFKVSSSDISTEAGPLALLAAEVQPDAVRPEKKTGAWPKLGPLKFETHELNSQLDSNSELNEPSRAEFSIL